MNKPIELLLTLDLQYFADEDLPADPNTPEASAPTTEDLPDQTGDTPEQGEAKFTQADIDRIVKERLERKDKQKEKELEEERKEAEKQRLLEEQRYKELYESLQKDLETQRETALKATKEALLVKAGYSDEQSTTLSKLLEGESDEELTASLESLKELFPPAKEKEYADPSPGNGGRHTPKKTNLEDKGRSAYQRLKSLGRI